MSFIKGTVEELSVFSPSTFRSPILFSGALAPLPLPFVLGAGTDGGSRSVEAGIEVQSGRVTDAWPVVG